MSNRGNVFHLNKEVIFNIFHHAQPLSAAEAYLFYFLLKNSPSLPTKRPFVLEEDFQNFAKTLEILGKMGYLVREEGRYRLGKRHVLSPRLNQSLWRFLKEIKKEFNGHLSPSDYLGLAGLVLLKRRFPFLKAHELQIALEKVFDLHLPYRQVEKLSLIAERVVNLINGLLRRRRRRLEAAKEALA